MNLQQQDKAAFFAQYWGQFVAMVEERYKYEQYNVVMPHPKTNRTFKHIWFFRHTNPTLKTKRA